MLFSCTSSLGCRGYRAIEYVVVVVVVAIIIIILSEVMQVNALPVVY